MNKLYKLFYKLWIKEYYSSTKRNSSIWVFGEWFGNRCIDNVLFFANYIASYYPHLRLYWISNPDTDTSLLNSKIILLYRNSIQAKNILKKCGVAVIGQSFEDLADYGPNFTQGAVSVLLWHGIPWKRIGHDSNSPKTFFKSIYIHILDYLDSPEFYASPSDEFDTIISTAFNAKKDHIIHVGYPRNSVFYHKEEICTRRRNIITLLNDINPCFDFSKCKIISYMPTFRNYKHGVFDFNELLSNKNFVSFLEKNNIIIVQKAHYVNQTRDSVTKIEGSNRIYSLNNAQAQDLLCASDLLVTDYSGAFFDYLLLDRPIIHYLYDYDIYRNHDRGLYYKQEDVVGGVVAYTSQELVNLIIEQYNYPDSFKDRRKRVRARYLKYESPDSCEVLYQEILKRISI